MSKFQNTAVVTRMAPSPTGHLHIGTARTALFNYLYAKKYNGTFIMRIEDTDKERSKKEYEEEILEGLEWLGMSWDALYRQSERTAIYRGYLELAISKGRAYVSHEESKMRPGEYVDVVRLKNPNTTITFEDEVRGEITFDTTELGDFVIARSIDDALYHFTVVVDDHEMGVTHVIRGEDHISNTPRQILIQEAIGAERPIYAHLPLILAPDRSKLSKRHGAVMLSEYERQGFIKESIINYLALLGWNPGTDLEKYTLEELTQAFDISGIQKSGAVFNIDKLKWFNKEYLTNYSVEEFGAYIETILPDALFALPQFSPDRLRKVIPLIKERSSTRDEVFSDFEAGEYDFAFKPPEHNPKLIAWKNDASPRESLSRLQKLAELIAQMPEELSSDEARSFIWDYAVDTGKGEVLWPLRVALTGRERSPDPFCVIHIIGSAESYKRVITACDTILRAS
ncbi:glutamate--tRNA ligase [Candidatus Kaiserbacteria bacterium]|nr:MAG: glutamate--tRNA ligase [Candidatus Kaiserbacteria bacterium]